MYNADQLAWEAYTEDFLKDCTIKANKILEEAGISKRDPEYSKRCTALINMFWMYVDSPANRRFCLYGKF